MPKVNKVKGAVPPPKGGMPTLEERNIKKREGTLDPFYGRWWLSDEHDAYKHINNVLHSIDNRQVARRFANARWYRLYTNYDSVGLVGGVFSRLTPVGSYASRSFQFTFNVVESCIDAAQAKIAKSKPLPRILTSGGTHKQQKKAKLLTKYLKGLFSELDIYAKAQDVFVDAAIFGTGVLKLFVEDGQIKAKRVCIDDIVIDEEDGRDHDPRQLHQRGHLNRDVLKELYPDKADLISNASSVLPGGHYTVVSEELVAVTESWHLPSGPNAGDGKHVICTDNCTLFSEEWQYPWFPFAVMRWKKSPLGWYGKGLAEILGPIQREINYLCNLIQESIRRVAKPNVFVPVDAGIISEHISYSVGCVINTRGQTPTFQTPTAQNEEVYQWVENLYRKAYELTGISQLSAQSMKPVGLDSGAALREYQDIETSRFEITGQMWEAFFCDIGKKLICLSRELYGQDEKISVNVKGRKFIETIEWKDASLEEDEYSMDMFPVNSLPNTPAGRLETIQQYAQAGFIDRTTALELLDFPDLEDYVTMEIAGVENAKMVVDKARWDGETTTITPLMNLMAVRNLAHNAYLEATQMDTPPANLDLLVNIMNEAQAWIDKATPPSPPPGPTPPPIGRPDLQPRNELLPVTPPGK